MTTNQAIQICKMHSIETRFECGKLMLREDYTLNRVAGHRWVECPESYRDLMFWLGY